LYRESCRGVFVRFRAPYRRQVLNPACDGFRQTFTMANVIARLGRPAIVAE
jgi:excinuclease UvrABC helicase subunit UvrB